MRPYLPESDQGCSLYGEVCCSASVWVPSDRLTNKAAFIRAATINVVNDRTGGLTSVPLAEEVGDYVVIARHFFSEEMWKQKVGEWSKISLSYESFDFGDKIKPRNEDQAAAWSAFSKQSHGVLNLACGKGKTVLALKKIAQRGVPAVVIVNNSGLMDQWKERALEFLDITEDDIGIVQGPRAEWDKPLVIAMIHTLAKRADTIPVETRARFGTVIFDEVHHLSAATFSQTAPMFFGNRYGLTATPNREDGLEDVYYSHVGRIFYSDLAGELEAEIYFKKVATPTPTDDSVIKDVTGEFSAGKMYKYFSEHSARNKVILKTVESALQKGRKILVLTHSKDHPNILLEKFLDSSCKEGYTAGAVSGDTSGELRTKIIEDSDVTFATFGVAREGLDVAALDTLVFASPFKAWGSFQQGKGRVERKHRNKKSPIVIVIDDYKFGPARAMCNHLRKSIRANGFKYKDLGRED